MADVRSPKTRAKPGPGRPGPAGRNVGSGTEPASGPRSGTEPDADGASDGAAARAARFIRDSVAAGDLVPGQRLVEPDLAARIGVSRASLREAYRALEAEGLVRIERYKGASVRRVERDELVEAFEIRELLEGLAARRAAGRLAASPLREPLTALMTAMERAAMTRGGLQAYGVLNRQFHELVLQVAGSRQLQALEHQIRPPAVVRLLHQRLAAAEAIDTSLAEHRVIVQALLDADADQAEAAMRRHVRSSLRSVLGVG